MVNRWIVLGFFCSAVLGYFGGTLALHYLPKLTSNSEALLQLEGMRRPIIQGYLPYWLIDKSATDYSSTLTDIAYFGLIVNGDGTIVTQTNPNETEPGWLALSKDNLKTKLNNAEASGVNRSLLLQSGDENAITKLITDPVAHAKVLMSQVEPIMDNHRFKDITIDIESSRQATESEQQQFTLFVKTLSMLAHEHNRGNVYIDIPVYAYLKPTIYDPARLPSTVDYVVLMAYDYHYRSSYVVGPVAPIDGGQVAWENDVDKAVKMALTTMKPEQLLLGVPLYGYEWETMTATAGAPIIPASGVTASNQRINDLLQSCTNCTVDRNPLSQELEIAYFDQTTQSFHQIAIGDKQTMESKVALAKKYKLAGVALWALGYEDSQLLSPLADYKDYRWILYSQH